MNNTHAALLYRIRKSGQNLEKLIRAATYNHGNRNLIITDIAYQAQPYAQGTPIDALNDALVAITDAERELFRLAAKEKAANETNSRVDDAQAYANKYLMPDAWGANVWHAVLDDAIRMRK